MADGCWASPEVFVDHACSRLTSRSPSGETGPRLIIRTCKHILDRGRFCWAPAVNKRDYCYAHLRLRRYLWRMARAKRRVSCLKLPALVDMQSAQAATRRVRAALAGGQMEARWARPTLWALQMIAANFRAMERRPTLRMQGANESARSGRAFLTSPATRG